MNYCFQKHYKKYSNPFVFDLVSVSRTFPSGKVRRHIMFPRVKSPPRRSRLITEKSLIYRLIYH
jgi:hypothetical protein